MPSLVVDSNGVFSENPVPGFQRKRTVSLDGSGQESLRSFTAPIAIRAKARNIHGGNLFDARYTLIDPMTYIFANSVDFR